VTELGPPEQRKRSGDLTVAAPAVSERAVPVVGSPVAVQRHAHLNPVLIEQPAPPLVEPHAVGMNAKIETTYRRNPRNQRGYDFTHRVLTQEQRLSAVQDNLDFRQLVRRRVLRNPLRGQVRSRGVQRP
jgi:hypothetical protein